MPAMYGQPLNSLYGLQPGGGSFNENPMPGAAVPLSSEGGWWQTNAPSGAGQPYTFTGTPTEQDLVQFFQSRGVGTQEVPYWLSKWSELEARGREIGNPNYAMDRLNAAEILGGGGGGAAGGGFGGMGGGASLQELLSVNPGYGIFQHLSGGMSPEDILKNDPGFKFRLQQGMDAIQRSAAAKGTLLTGGTLKDLQEYGQGLASNEYGNVFNRQFNLANLGSNIYQGQVGNQFRLAELGKPS